VVNVCFMNVMWVFYEYMLYMYEYVPSVGINKILSMWVCWIIFGLFRLNAKSA
jgi:hypothetical protein